MGATWMRSLVAGAAVAAAAGGVSPFVGPVGARLAPASASVIVQGDDPAGAVRALGGTVTFDLPIVGGVAAQVPADSVDRLRGMAGVRAVTADAPVRMQASLTTSTNTNASTVNSVFAREVQADLLWAEGITGKGVRVALIDTGVTAVPDLRGRIVTDLPDPVTEGAVGACANFAGDGTCDDQYGHGTFLAGLIAGNGAASGGVFRGVAPEAEIVSIKIAGRDGSSDVSKLLAAIQYVVSFREELGIDVLNLSLGTDSKQSYRTDPLNYAVQQAWRSGITVVVAAGNLPPAQGPRSGTISKPADDPFVITTGATDDRETPATSDDRVPNFSSRGPAPEGVGKPDVTAPGARVVSLRAPGSHVETVVGGGVVGTPYRRGSGTSMSAAVVSGVAAVVLDANDEAWSPNQVKAALTRTTTKVGLTDPAAVGAGMVQAYRAAKLADPGEANVGVEPGNGMGSLDASRGTVQVDGPCSPVERQLDPACRKTLDGDDTATGEPFSPKEFVEQGNWDDTDWYMSQWANPTLLGTSWYGTSWYGTSWYGTSWYGTSWYGTSWYGSSWDGDAEPTTNYGTPIPGGAWYGAWQ
ncbi:MAG TPA: S8 family serine peptidase [Acidimicrobiales bacterium]